MRLRSAPLLLVLACGAAPAAPPEPAAPPPATTTPPLPAPPPVAPTAAPPAPPAPAKATAHFKVTTAMKMDGTVDEKALVTEANAQLDKVSACAAIVRKTDQATGSLNLKVQIAKNGATKAELQSPTSDEAKTCILDAVNAWKLTPKAAPGARWSSSRSRSERARSSSLTLRSAPSQLASSHVAMGFPWPVHRR